MEPLTQPITDLIGLGALAASLVLVSTWTTYFVVKVLLSWTGYIQDDL
jgi:hypothetical protein